MAAEDAGTREGSGPGRRGLRERAERVRLDRGAAADRITAYVYGNIIVLAALVPLTGTVRTPYAAALIVVGTTLSTYVAHVFADAVGEGVRGGAHGLPALLRDSQPILVSGVVPLLLLLASGLEWLDVRWALIGAQIYLVARIAGITFVVTWLRGERPTGATLAGAVGLAVLAVGVVAVKIWLTH